MITALTTEYIGHNYLQTKSTHCRETGVSGVQWTPVCEPTEPEARPNPLNFNGFDIAPTWSYAKNGSPFGDAVFCIKISARRGSNPRPSPWQGDAIPLSHSRISLASLTTQVKLYSISTQKSSIFLFLFKFIQNQLIHLLDRRN